MLAAVSGFDGGRKSVLVAEVEIVADAADSVEVVSDGVLSESGQWVHGVNELNLSSAQLVEKGF